jgi:hypothetical protein
VYVRVGGWLYVLYGERVADPLPLGDEVEIGRPGAVGVARPGTSFGPVMLAVSIAPASAGPPRTMTPATAIAATTSTRFFPTISVSLGRQLYANRYTQRRYRRFTS